MVEAIAHSIEDKLISGLQFSHKPTAKYVTDRKYVSWFPSGAEIYSPGAGGSKVIKVRLNADGWLDPSTVKLQFTVNNKDATNAMTLLSSGNEYFRRVRVMVKSAVVEDIDQYNRYAQMFQNFESEGVNRNKAIEGSRQWDDWEASAPEEIPASGKRNMSVKLLSGLLNQEKWIPLNWCPVELELELVNNVADCQTGSTDWDLSNIQIKGDVCTLDNGMQNDYASHLLEGKALSLNYATYISQDQVVTNSEFSVNISRAVSRLKSLFISFQGTPHANNTTYLKDFNNFWHPMSSGTNGGEYDSGKELEFQVQIGSKLFPEYPIRSTSEFFSQLIKCLGIHQSPFHSVNVSGNQYRNYKFVVGIDTEKVLEMGYSGLNSKHGDLLTIKCKPTDAAGMGTNAPSKVFCLLHSDNILEIRQSGITIFD